MRPSFPMRKTRTVYVAIATIMLAGPASALALAGTGSNNSAAAGPVLRANVTPRRPHFDHPVTVTGIAPAADVGHWATLAASPAHQSRWRYLASTHIGSGGKFRLRVRLRSSGLVRVIDSAVPPPVRPGATRGDFTSSQISSAGLASDPLAVVVVARLEVGAAQHRVRSGDQVHVRGRLLPGRAGREVFLLGHFRHGFRTVARAHTGAAGGFTLRYTPAGGVQRRLRVTFAGDRYNAPARAPAGRLTVYTASVASWYDDAGNTACGFHAGLGVANKTLPCGTRVNFLYRGRSVTATVDDRGPFVAGREWDLNQNTAAALGFAGVGTVWTAG